MSETGSCRFYAERYPEVDQVVMVNVRQIAEMGAYVKLLEYDNIEGMILLSELSRRRIRSIQKLVRVGRNEVVVVMRVDKEKGYIDLSKRRVSPEDIVKCEERYNKSKAVHSILRHVAEKGEIPLLDLYEKVAWPLAKTYGHAYDAFKVAITESEQVFGTLGSDLPPAILPDLKSNIARRLTPQPIKIRADIEVTCFGYEGIDAIRAALKEAESLQTEEIPIKVKLVAPPLYVIVTNSTAKQGGLDLIEQAIEKIEKRITKANGTITVKMRARVVSDMDDKELADLMAKVENENKEISGDEVSDEDELGEKVK